MVTQQVERSERRHHTHWPSAALGVAAMVLLAGSLGALVVQHVVPTLAGTAVLVVGVVLALRVEIAALAFVALEPFEDYLKTISPAGVKLFGAVVFGAWVLRLLSRSRSAQLNHPAVRAAAVLFAVLLAALAVHPNGPVGVQVFTRYMSYLGIFIVLVDCMRNRLKPTHVANVYVGSCTIAAVCGLISFLHGQLRAGGPVGDPNDFAFFLIAAIPLALGLRARARWPVVYDLAVLIMGLAVLGTLSRGALVGAAAMLAYAVLSSRVRPRALVGWLAVAAVLGGGALLTQQVRVTTSLSAKSQVAQQNVDERLQRWIAAAEMTADNPVLGVGPAGFRQNYNTYTNFRDTDPTHNLDVAHETYLEISSELGVGGLAAFAAMLSLSWCGARRRARWPGHAQASVASAVCVALVGTSVAAVFVTEQYFLPLWLLAALGVAFDPRGVPNDGAETADGGAACA